MAKRHNITITDKNGGVVAVIMDNGQVIIHGDYKVYKDVGEDKQC